MLIALGLAVATNLFAYWNSDRWRLPLMRAGGRPRQRAGARAHGAGARRPRRPSIRAST